MKRIIIAVTSALMLSGCSGEKTQQNLPVPQTNSTPNVEATSPPQKTPAPVGSDWSSTPMSETQFLLGTSCNIKLYDGRQQKTMDKAFARIAELEQMLSANESGTEVDTINESAGVWPVKVGPETIFVVKKGLEYSQKTEGSFDISIGPIVNLWRIGFPDARIPAQAEIDAALPLIDYKDVEIDEAKGTVFLKRVGMRIDLGAIAKGYVADEVAVVLRENGVTSALINMGGNILAMGSKNGDNWNIGIQDPDQMRNEIVGSIRLTDRTVVTSGIYERYLVGPDGKRYHHILNPFSGYPYDNEIEGVSIICDESVDGDGLSTSVFSKSLEEGMAFVEEIPNVDAIFIMSDKSLYLTSGIRNTFELTNSSYKIAN